MTPLVDAVCSAKRIKYSDVLELDKLIQDFEPHPYTVREVKPRQDGACIQSQEGIMSFLHPIVTSFAIHHCRFLFTVTALMLKVTDWEPGTLLIEAHGDECVRLLIDQLCH